MSPSITLNITSPEKTQGLTIGDDEVGVIVGVGVGVGVVDSIVATIPVPPHMSLDVGVIVGVGVGVEVGDTDGVGVTAQSNIASKSKLLQSTAGVGDGVGIGHIPDEK